MPSPAGSLFPGEDLFPSDVAGPVSSPPESGSAAARALSLLGFMRVDATSDAILEILIGSWMRGLERPAQVAYGVDEQGFAWEALSDPVRAPLWALPHAALYTGGTMPVRQPGEADDAFLTRARAEVVRPRGMLRGSYSALATAIQAHLTGTRFVSIVEWVDDSPWLLAARVRTDECPNPAAVVVAANDPAAIPAGMHVQLVLATGPVWDEITETWDEMGATSWDDLEEG
jgi:hypothetical protein